MSLLIDLRCPGWKSDKEFADLIAPHMGGITLNIGPPTGLLDDVRMLATIDLNADALPHLPNLELIQKVGAGVDSMLGELSLPDHLQIARLGSNVQAREIAEYCLAEVLAVIRNQRGYARQQRDRKWLGYAPRLLSDLTIAVLGLGFIGTRIVDLFQFHGATVLGWSRTEKSLEKVETYTGDAGLATILEPADFVISVLPSTPATCALIDAANLDRMGANTYLINVGRGDLIDEVALLEALNSGVIAGATLDVFAVEPLPENSPLWDVPGLAISPHVSGWTVNDSYVDIAENYRRLIAGQPILHLVDRARGY